MFELLEKTMLSAIGAVAITQKKGEELVAEMKDRYKLSEDEGKAFVDRMQGLAKESREKVQQMAETEVQKVVDRLGLVTREEYDRLVKRVQELEARTP
ncbi:MAG TPA: phasin superfamily protein [Desulfuromonadales bacterium]|nr:phasin superfamily protein [Desulfuromonadales bacterium]